MNATKFRFEQLAGGNTHKLYIYDDVTAYGPFNWETWDYDESETSAKYFREQLEAIPDSGSIELHVNSNGGSVKEGIAIYNQLKQHKAEKICYVDGFAYSIASVICMACDKIIMGQGTSMLIHNMSMSVYGDAKMLRKCADDLDVLMESNRQVYMERAKNLTEEELKEMMDKETFLTPEQCLEYGFCDEISTSKVDPGPAEPAGGGYNPAAPAADQQFPVLPQRDGTVCFKRKTSGTGEKRKRRQSAQNDGRFFKCI